LSPASGISSAPWSKASLAAVALRTARCFARLHAMAITVCVTSAISSRQVFPTFWSVIRASPAVKFAPHPPILFQQYQPGGEPSSPRL